MFWWPNCCNTLTTEICVFYCHTHLHKSFLTKYQEGYSPRENVKFTLRALTILHLFKGWDKYPFLTKLHVMGFLLHSYRIQLPHTTWGHSDLLLLTGRRGTLKRSSFWIMVLRKDQWNIITMTITTIKFSIPICQIHLILWIFCFEIKKANCFLYNGPCSIALEIWDLWSGLISQRDQVAPMRSRLPKW